MQSKSRVPAVDDGKMYSHVRTPRVTRALLLAAVAAAQGPSGPLPTVSDDPRHAHAAHVETERGADDGSGAGEGIETRESSATRLHREAQAAFGDMRHDEALRLLQELEASTPDFPALPAALQTRGAALASLGRAEEALEQWRRAMAAGRRLGTGDAFERGVNGYVMHAAQSFHQAAAGAPDDPHLRVGAGVLAEAVGKHDVALEHLRAARRLSPEQPGVLLALGRIHAHASQPELARPLLQSALALRPAARAGLSSDFSTLGAVTSQLEDTDASHAAYVAAYDAAVAARDTKAAAVAIASACMVLIKGRGEAAIDEARALGARGVASGVLLAPLQLPQLLVHGLSARGWWDDARSWRVVRTLEAHAAEIREEVLRVHGAGSGALPALAALTPSETGLIAAGQWHEIDIVRNGIPVERSIEMLPVTSKVVLSLREATSQVRGVRAAHACPTHAHTCTCCARAAHRCMAGARWR